MVGLQNKTGNEERNKLKLKKIIKDIAHIHERFEGNLPGNCPLSRYSYFVLSPIEYVNSVLEYEQLQKAKTSKETIKHNTTDIKKEEVNDNMEEVKIESKKIFEITKEVENEIRKMLEKYMFDFKKVHEELLKLYPECEYTQKDLQQHWAKVEMQNYRRKKLHPK